MKEEGTKRGAKGYAVHPLTPERIVLSELIYWLFATVTVAVAVVWLPAASVALKVKV